MKLKIHTRMALQMCAALTVAFAIGLPFFHEHWPWVVLSAFIVCSGAVTRDDALGKGAQRFLGAAGGTLLASVLGLFPMPNDVVAAAAIFAVLFAGIWLREINYAYWAACTTLIFALLQGGGGSPGPLFLVRIVCILIGTLCAVGALEFVFPISREALARRRRSAR